MHELLERIDEEIRQAVAGLDATGTQATPDGHPEKWSIQQIVDHLVLSYGAMMTVVRTRLEKGTPTLARQTMQQRLGSLTVISLGHFPAGRKAPANVQPMKPAAVESGEELAARAHASLSEMDGVLHRAEEMFGTARAASHPVLGPLSMAQWRKFHLVHAEHHLGQIAAIRRANAL